MIAHGGDGGLRSIKVDLHVHTVVSPCAEVEMIPPLIVKRAGELGLGLIAVTDHNTADNVEAVQLAARDSDLTVLPGMEVQTREEAHILCLFDTLEQVRAWQEIVYENLPPLKNREDVFGAQFVVDETGAFVRMNDRLLLTSVGWPVEQVVSDVQNLGGLSIAAHIDRPAFSLLANLGFVPPGLALAALEITHRTSLDAFIAQHKELRGWPFIISGDAHQLSEMRADTVITCRQPSIRELGLAFRGEQGRGVTLLH